MKQRTGRRILTLLAAMTLLILNASGVFAETQEETAYVVNEWNFVDGAMDVSRGIPEDAQGVLARIREQGVLRVATEPYFAPQEFIDPELTGQAQFAGADMELARLIAARMGVELEIVPMEFTEVLTAVGDDRCDLAISALAFVPSRAISSTLSKGYFFADAPANNTLVIRAADAAEIRTKEDLADRILTAQRGSLQEALTVEEIRDYREFFRVSQAEEVFEAVRSGEADAGIVDMENLENYIRSNPECGLSAAEGFRFALAEQYTGDRIAAKKGEAELMYFVNGVIDEVLEKDLYTLWYNEARKRADELGL